MPFSIGDKAKIKPKISKKSYFIYEDYRKSSPYIVCPCSLKNKIVTVKKLLDNGIALCTFHETAISIIYTDDLEKLSN